MQIIYLPANGIQFSRETFTSGTTIVEATY